MNKDSLLNWCKEHFTPLLKEHNYEIVDVEYVKEAQGKVLRFFIDNIDDQYITIEDCEQASSIISDELDIQDPISESYFLEVSTPGIEREFRFPKDYRRNTGKKVIVKLYQPKENVKEFIGILKSFDEASVLLQVKNKDVNLAHDDISSIKLSLF